MADVPAIVPTVIDEPMDFTVIAHSPKEMERAQRSLILWAARKIQAIKQDIAETETELQQAVERKWNASGWRRELSKKQNCAEFYRKIKMALEAGYYIVPPFPMDVFAIRTNKALPKRMDSQHRDNHDQLPQALPIGEGRYVDPKPERWSYPNREKKSDGTFRDLTYYYAHDFKDAGFPFKLAKAEIRAATDAALALKVFDQVGVLPRVRAPDPIVCGQILYPNIKLYRHYEHNKAITFFVTWWLDTKTL